MPGFIVVATAILAIAFLRWQWHRATKIRLKPARPTPSHGYEMDGFFGIPCNVSGESFSNDNGTSRQTIIAQLAPGDPVIFVPEPSNPVDRNAVAIFSSAGQIGYLPKDRRQSETVRGWLKRGTPIQARIHSKGRPRGSKNYGVVLDVWEEDKS